MENFGAKGLSLVAKFLNKHLHSVEMKKNLSIVTVSAKKTY